MADPVSILSILTGPIFDWLGKRQERKAAKDSLKAKATMAKQEQGHAQTLTDAEWEVVVAAQFSSTWKDEFALIVGTFPYLAIFGSSLYYGLTGNYEMLEGTMAGIHALSGVGVDVGFLITAVILAASGLSVWRLFGR